MAGHSGGEHRRCLPQGHAVGDLPARSGEHLNLGSTAGKFHHQAQPRNTVLTPNPDIA